MNYKKKEGADWLAIIEQALSFKGDRLAFARYMYTVAKIDNDPIHIRYWNKDECGCSTLVDQGKNFDWGENLAMGGSGFGFVKDEFGKWLEIPHIGRVVIGDNVRIGSNCCIDRGTIEDTVIGDGTKIDNMVHIAHNCKIGKNVIICAGVTFCGSVTVEDDVWLAPGTLIKEGVTIGKGAKTGLGAVVIEDVKPGTLVYGCPAKEKS